MDLHGLSQYITIAKDVVDTPMQLLVVALVCIPAIYTTAHPLRVGGDTEFGIIETRAKFHSSFLGISLKAPKKIKKFDEFIIKIKVTNYGDEDIQLIRTPDSVLYNRKDFTEVDSDNGTLPQGLADSLQWIDLGDGKPRFQSMDDREEWDIDKFINPMRKAAKDESTGTWNRRRGGDTDAGSDGEDDEVGSKPKPEEGNDEDVDSESTPEEDTERELDGFGFMPDAAERKKRLVTLRKKGLKLSGSSSKTFLYDANDAYISHPNVARYGFRLMPQKFSYTKNGGKTISQTEVTLEEDFTVELKGSA